MKKITFIIFSIFLFLSTQFFASAEIKNECIDLKNNLSKGKTSAEIKSLQNFLILSGFLKAEPTGYFGNGTLNAVKLYQKSKNLTPSGLVLSLTRKSIKDDTCTISATQNTNTEIRSSTTTKEITRETMWPEMTSLSKSFFFEGGKGNTVTLNGSNFSTSTNLIYVSDKNTGRKYLLGTFPSTDSGNTINIPNSITSSYYSCGGGNGCSQLLPPGEYNMSVLVSGKESNGIYFVIKNFTATGYTGTSCNSITANATSSKIGNVGISGGDNFKINYITANIHSDTLSSSNFYNYVLKDEVTNSIIENQYPSFIFTPPVMVSELQTKVFGLYADTKTMSSGQYYVSFDVEIEDFISKTKTLFTTQEFMVTVSGVI